MIDKQTGLTIRKIPQTPSVWPEWLGSPLPEEPELPSQAQTLRLREEQYTNALETVLDKLMEGRSIRSILKEDPRELDQGEFMKWVNKNPVRKARFREAQEVGAEMIAAEILDISDGIDSNGNPVMEDVQRSKLRIETRKYLLGVWDRKRFGDVKQLELSGTISISKALEEASARVLGAQIIDAEFEEVNNAEADL